MRDHERRGWQDWADDAVAESSDRTGLGLSVVPLLPRHDLHLFCFDGDGWRFARVFREVWEKVPSPIRRKLLARWSGPRRELAGLLDGIGHRKYGFTVCLTGLDSLPDQAIECLIARQTAEAACEIDAGEWCCHTSDCDAGSSCGCSGETDPDALAESWGFDMALLDEVFGDREVDAND